MDGSGDGDGPMTVPVAADGEIRKSARRRLIQATLFAQKPPEPERKSEDRECTGDGEKGSGRVEEDEDEGMCGSQSKKKRGRKGKSTPPANAPRKEKSPLKRTPKKRKSSGCEGQGAVDLAEIEESTPPSLPDLRLEAKLTAEENSRRFAGKQIHPFFSALKVGKKSQETTELQNGCCSVVGLDKRIAAVGPVHVFEREQDDVVTLDWKDWIFVEESPVYSCRVEEGHKLGGSIEAIGFDRAFGATCTSDESLMEVAASYPPFQPKLLHEASTTVAEMPSNIPAACHHHVAEAETDFEIIGVRLPDGDTAKSGIEQQSECFQERIMSHNAACSNQPDKILWTDKYQPRKAMDVCGNNESVKFLNEWLQDWRKRGHRSSVDLSGCDEFEMQDADYDALQSDCDSEDIDEETSRKNVLLITGPAGSGKSAAIYACAKEQGFKILEISASETRSSLIVKQKFGEALESQSLEWTQESLTGPECKDSLKFPKILSNSEVTKELDDEVMEVIHIPDEDSLLGAHMTPGKFSSKDGSSEPTHNQLKPAVLFEDVDIVFPEDRGLTAAIQQIAEKAKGPVILTSNCVQPVLPDNLHRLQVCFSMPSKEELLQHLHMVSTSEKAKIQPVFLEQLIHNCQSDIRQTIMHLQFWCQGNQSQRASKVPKLAPVLFDPEAGHKIFPKLMPWNFPSPLSELVEMQISASLAMLKDVSVSMDFSKQETENKEMDISGKDSVEAKKEAMLSMNCSEEDYNDFLTPSKSASGNFSPSITPDLSSMRKSRRKLNVVMSSDSEDEYLLDSFPSTLERDNHSLPLEVDCEVPLDCQGPVHDCLNLSTSMHPCFGSIVPKEDPSECSETAIELSLKDTSRLADMSFVAESSFVPETEINDAGDISHSGMSFNEETNSLEDVSIGHKFGQELLPTGGDQLCEATPTLENDSDLLGTGFNLLAASLEEVEDSQSRHVQAVTREFQQTDQCSRMDFNVEHVLVEEPSPSLLSHSLQESWRKLRDNHADLKDIVASEIKDAPGIVELAYQFSNHISETELLLSKCPLLDFCNWSTIVSDESEAFSQSNDGLMMTSAIGQHGLCFYANEVASVRLKLSSVDEIAAVSFNREILSTDKLMEVGGFDEHNAVSGSTSSVREEEHRTQSRSGTILSRVPKSRLFYIVQSLVPSRMLMTLRGDTIHEYISSLACISRSEASRLSGSLGRPKRRGRTPRNYLSTGSLMLSPEEISLLCRCNLYGRSSSNEGDTNNR